MKMIKKLIDFIISKKEIVLYVVFGGLTTVVNWAVYMLFVNWTGITVANVIAWIAAVLFAYVTNKLFVFEQKSWQIRLVAGEFAKFVSSRIVTGVIEIVGVDALVYIGLDMTLFGKKGMVAKILVSVIVVILNYVFSKLLVFRQKRVKDKK